MTTQRQISDNLNIFFCSAYKRRPSRVRLSFNGTGRTKQAFKAECDINQIMARFQRTGVLDFQQKQAPRYGDCTGFDFQSAQLVVAQAQSMFAELPSRLRDRFGNDPGEFLAFVQNPRNREEAQELGLLAKKTPAEAGEASQVRREPTGQASPTTPTSSTQPEASQHPHDKGGRGGKTNTST